MECGCFNNVICTWCKIVGYGCILAGMVAAVCVKYL